MSLLELALGVLWQQRILTTKLKRNHETAGSLFHWYKGRQKNTTFFGLLDTWSLPNAFTVPECKPAFTSSRFLRRSSFFSSFDTSAFFRLKVWKSSSSAPASPPVPKIVVAAVPETSFFRSSQSFARCVFSPQSLQLPPLGYIPFSLFCGQAEAR